MTDKTILICLSMLGHGVLIISLMERAGLTIDKHPYMRMGVCWAHAILLSILGYYAVFAS